MKKFTLSFFIFLFTSITFAGITPEAQQLIDAQLKQVEPISSSALNQEIQTNKNLVLIDVRQKIERPMMGIITQNDIHIPRSFLEIRTFSQIPDRNTDLVVYCGKGIRSAFSANTLKAMGYKNVRNLTGGIKNWIESGFPTLEP